MAALAALMPEALDPLVGRAEHALTVSRSSRSRRRVGREDHPRPVPVANVPRPLEVTIASERAEWEQAFQLVASSYQARGYEVPRPGGIRFTPYHALPDTVTFVAKHEQRVVATLSLVPDNAILGLPMECVYAQELERLRRAGRRLVEVTSLADSGLSLREFVPVFVTLLRLSAQYGIQQGADTWVISINPRHRSFYRKVMGFVPLGPWRAYPSVQNHPAEAYWLDVPLLQTNAPAMYEQIFSEWLPRDAFCHRPMPPDLVRYFGRHSTQTDSETIHEILGFVEHFGSPRRWL